MDDHEAPAEDPDELAPEEDGRIRDLLASARETGAVPDDVATRLDARLAALTASRRTPWVRRHASRLLVAAVVVVVAGCGTFLVRQVHERTGGSAGSSASSTSGSGTGDSFAGPQSDRAGAPRLTSRRFARQVETLLAGPVPSAGRATPPGCGSVTLPPGVEQRRPVTLDGRPALLDVYAARSGRQLVRAVTCSGDRVLASARVPAG